MTQESAGVTTAQPAQPAQQTYRAALVGCSRMGAFIDNEILSRPGDMPTPIVLPYSHATGYETHPRTQLVAGCDLRPDVLRVFGERYGISPEHQYTDYRELIRNERPDILSIATQPEQRAEVILFAAEHGVRAIYAEKPLCASVAEAHVIVAAVETHKIAFNMGTNRRWYTGFQAMRQVIESGELGALKTLILGAGGQLFNTTSHWFDLLLQLAGDAPVAWVQAYLPKGDELIQGDIVTEDPEAMGVIAFADGVMAHVLLGPRVGDTEAQCEHGSLLATGTGMRFHKYRLAGDGPDTYLMEEPFPAYERASATLLLIDDLVQALDSGGPTRGGVRVAQANNDLIFGFIESHRRGGARVPLPLRDNTLRFHRAGRTPNRPRFEPAIPASPAAPAGGPVLQSPAAR
jgi:predicted dehydrogenase